MDCKELIKEFDKLLYEASSFSRKVWREREEKFPGKIQDSLEEKQDKLLDEKLKAGSSLWRVIRGNEEGDVGALYEKYCLKLEQYNKAKSDLSDFRSRKWEFADKHKPISDEHTARLNELEAKIIEAYITEFYQSEFE